MNVIIPKLNKMPEIILTFFHSDYTALFNELIMQKNLFYLFFKENVKYTTILYLV